MAENKLKKHSKDLVREVAKQTRTKKPGGHTVAPQAVKTAGANNAIVRMLLTPPPKGPSDADKAWAACKKLAGKWVCDATKTLIKNKGIPVEIGKMKFSVLPKLEVFGKKKMFGVKITF